MSVEDRGSINELRNNKIMLDHELKKAENRHKHQASEILHKEKIIKNSEGAIHEYKVELE